MSARMSFIRGLPISWPIRNLPHRSADADHASAGWAARTNPLARQGIARNRPHRAEPPWPHAASDAT